jgi:N-acetylmannosamine-6-phosphate 2-epimerase / N-acetylmannosamine kinase
MTALAIDIGGTKTLVALVEGARVVEAERISTDPSAGGEGIVEAVAGIAATWAGRFDRAGAAVTGLVRDGLWQTLNPRTLALPLPFPLEAALAERLGCPAHVVNDAQAAAWGEWSAGAGQREDMVFLTVSTGIGGGIVTGGRLVGGLGGHFGQWVDGSGTRLEDRVSGRWIAAAARGAGHPVEAAEVFAALPAPWAEAIVTEGAARLAVLCRNIQLALDPRRIVVGGGIGLAPGTIARIEAAFADLDPVLRPTLVPAARGAEAGLIGAAALVRQVTLKRREKA